MLHEIVLEALYYFDRTALEVLQMHSRYLRNLVNSNARTLSIRYIHEVNITYGKVYIQLPGHDMVYVTAPGEQDVEMLFRRMNNAFIERLTLRFCRENIRLPRYLRSNADDFQCRNRTFHVMDSDEKIDYSLVDWLAVRLKPRICEAFIWSASRVDDYALLFAQSALRGSVTHLEYKLHGSDPAPDCIIPELFGVDVVERCVITTGASPRSWIGTFVEMFESSERGTDVVQMVTLVHTRFFDDSPILKPVDPLRLQRRTNVPIPHNAFIKDWARTEQEQETATTESPLAELFVIENAKAAKKLEPRTGPPFGTF